MEIKYDEKVVKMSIKTVPCLFFFNFPVNFFKIFKNPEKKLKFPDFFNFYT